MKSDCNRVFLVNVNSIHFEHKVYKIEVGGYDEE